MELSDTYQNQELLRLYNNDNLDNEDKIIRTKQIFDSTGASRATKQIIEAYTEKAFRLLDTISISSEKKVPLKQFGIELMNRNV